MKTAIELKGVEGWLNIFEITEEYLKDRYLKIVEAILAIVEMASGMIRDGAKEKVEEEFASMVEYLLEGIGLKVKPASISLRFQNDPGRGAYFFAQGEVMDIMEGEGFTPKLIFYLDHDRPVIKAECVIENKGRLITSFFIKPGILAQASKPLIKRVKINQISPGKFSIVPLSNVGEFIDGMRNIADFLGEEKIKKLAELEDAMRGVTDPMKSPARDFFSTAFLEAFGVQFCE